MKSLVVDTRWSGAHGIGRYSTEVIQRLQSRWEPLRVTSRAGSPRDFITARRAARNAIIYSPGYNAGCTRTHQILTVHDLIHLGNGSTKYRAYYECILKLAIRRAGTVLTVSETSRQAIVEWVNDSRVEVVNAGNGCSFAFTPGKPRSPLPYEYLLYVGNLKPHKNVTVLLSAMRHLTGLRLIMVTPNITATKAAARTQGVENLITPITGLEDGQLCDLYRGATATVLPSTLEGFGLPALESLASGTPVVYWAGCASVAEIVGSHGVAVTSSSDPTEWAFGIETASRLSSVSTIDLRERYNWETVAGKVNSLLKRELSK